MSENKTEQKIQPIDDNMVGNLRKKSAYSLPTRPSERGMTPDEIKRAFYAPLIDSEKSMVKEVNRIVGEANDALNASEKWVQETVDGAKTVTGKHAKAAETSEKNAKASEEYVRSLPFYLSPTDVPKPQPSAYVVLDGGEVILYFDGHATATFEKEVLLVNKTLRATGYIGLGTGDDTKYLSLEDLKKLLILTGAQPNTRDWPYFKSQFNVTKKAYFTLLNDKDYALIVDGKGRVRVTGSLQINDEEAATRKFVYERVEALVNSAPGTLDTLGEIAKALTNEESATATILKRLGNIQVYTPDTVPDDPPQTYIVMPGYVNNSNDYLQIVIDNKVVMSLNRDKDLYTTNAIRSTSSIGVGYAKDAIRFNRDDFAVLQALRNLVEKYDSEVVRLNKTIEVPAVTVDGKEIATQSFVATKIAEMVNSSPETLDTLAEIATALGNDPNFATTIMTMLGNKADKVNETELNEMLAEVLV